MKNLATLLVLLFIVSVPLLADTVSGSAWQSQGYGGISFTTPEGVLIEGATTLGANSWGAQTTVDVRTGTFRLSFVPSNYIASQERCTPESLEYCSYVGMSGIISGTFSDPLYWQGTTWLVPTQTIITYGSANFDYYFTNPDGTIVEGNVIDVPIQYSITLDGALITRSGDYSCGPYDCPYYVQDYHASATFPAVPEPSSLLLVVTGGVMSLAGLRKRFF